MRSPCKTRSTMVVGFVVTTAVLVLHQAGVHGFDGSSYARNTSLGTSTVDIFWTIDTELQTIRVALHAKTATGWAGIGTSEMGGMEGADIVFYESASDSITDAHSLTPGTPVTDECTQDWSLLSAEVGTDGLVFEAERALYTGDTQDKEFADDSGDGSFPTRLFAAWGDEETITYHGTADVAQGQVFLFGEAGISSDTDPVVGLASDADVSFFDVTADKFNIPTTRTWYELSCVPMSELPMLDEFHVIGFEGIVQNDTTKYVHHLVLKAYYATDDCGQTCYGDTSSTSSSSSSSSDSSTSSTSGCEYSSAMIYDWTPGSESVVLPDDVGYRFGTNSSSSTSMFRSVGVQTHYDNADGDAGMVDSSGVRVYYSKKLRSVDMGVITFGDPYVLMDGVTLPDGKSSFSFDCPSSCFEEQFEESVTIFYRSLHMHEAGQRLQTRQYRNDSDGNEVLVHSTEVEYYSFLQAGTHEISGNNSVTIQKGDRFETDCHYDTSLSSEASHNVTFGTGSENEMCIDFVFYYPSQNIPFSGACGLGMCGGSLANYQELGADSDFNRTFGIIADACSDGDDSDNTDSSKTESTTSSARSTSHSGRGPMAFTAATTLALVGVYRSWFITSAC